MKNIISVLLSAMLCIALFASCGEAVPEVPKYTADEPFRMAAWSIPYHANTGYGVFADNEDYSTYENWLTMKEAGFNYAYPTNDITDDHIRTTLTRAEEVGIKVLVRDYAASGLHDIIAEKGSYNDARQKILAVEGKLKEKIDEFKEYESFAGIIGYDEPSMDHFPAIAAAQDWFLNNYPEYEFYINHFPVYASNSQLYGVHRDEGYNYADFVDKYMEIVRPPLISYDHYPMVRDGADNPYIMHDFLYNLNVFAKAAKEHDVPFYLFIQSMGFFDNIAITTYREFAWQAYTSLAFGTKGLQLFCYWTLLQEEYLNNVRGAMVERDGTKNPIYYGVQEVFNEIKSFEDIYMNFNWDGVKTYSSGSVINEMFRYVDDQLDKLEGVREVTVNNDVVIGQFFDGESRPGFMVANASEPFIPETAMVEMTFENTKYVLVCKKGRQIVHRLNKNKLTLELGSGEGYFVIPL